MYIYSSYFITVMLMFQLFKIVCIAKCKNLEVIHVCLMISHFTEDIASYPYISVKSTCYINDLNTMMFYVSLM